MNRVVILLFAAAILSACAGNAFAWSLAVDKPLQFTWADKAIRKGGDVRVDDASTSDVPGFKIAVTGPWKWLGVGYETYDVKADGTSPGGPFKVELSFQFYDVFVQFPLSFMNVGLGVGQGEVNAQVTGTGSHTGGGPSRAGQYFAVLGVPAGRLWDFHMAYHVISTEDTPMNNGTGKLRSGGSVIMAGFKLGM
jgi:hypothetical protein